MAVVGARNSCYEYLEPVIVRTAIICGCLLALLSVEIKLTFQKRRNVELCAPIAILAYVFVRKGLPHPYACCPRTSGRVLRH